VPDSVWFNPGGLAGVWAEENSRESIWAALNRREVFSTSGPRITVRFFGGFSFPADFCEDPEYVRHAYDRGVPMGGELYAPEVGPAPPPPPTFLVSAAQDAGTGTSPGTPLDRVQVVKIWLAAGQVHEKVFDVAKTDAPDDLDPATCNAPKSGASTLCGTWTDPEYDPAAPALYYARVLEKPSCRWTGLLCAKIHADCSHRGNLPSGFDFCCDEDVAKVVRERALASPIWIPVVPSKPAG
jgi:hypothetical protein